MLTTTRLGLPQSQITDISTTNYNLGIAPRRTIVADGVVRDTVNALGFLLDGATDYNYDEQIAGRWEFQAPVISDKGFGQLFINNTGGARVSGDVVILDPAVDSSVILSTSVGVNGGKVGVVAEAIAGGAIGRVAFSGFIRVKVVPGALRGQYLQTQSASVIAGSTVLPATGSFAIAVTNPDGANTVLATMGKLSTLEGGGTINGNVGIIGNVGIGTASITNVGLLVQSGVTVSGNEGDFISITGTLTSVANGDQLSALKISTTFAPAGHTSVSAFAINIGSVTGANTNNYGIFINTPSGASGQNIGLYNNGSSALIGNVGIGSPPQVSQALAINTTVTGNGGQATGITTTGTIQAGANGDALYGNYIVPSFQLNGKLNISAIGLYLNLTGSAMSGAGNFTGIRIDGVSGANLNNYCIYINTPSGAAGVNEAIHVVGGNTYLGGVLQVAQGLNNYAASGAIRLNNGTSGNISWRNGGNTGDLSIGADGSNQLQIFGGWVLDPTSPAAGAGGALPGNPATYARVVWNGIVYKMALYTNS